MLKWLLSDPDVDVRIKGPLGITALHCAAKYSTSSVTTASATTSAAASGTTAAATIASVANAAAAAHEGAEMCALLLKAGVPVDAVERCSSGDTCSADAGQ
jgi:hypothetical protein